MTNDSSVVEESGGALLRSGTANAGVRSSDPGASNVPARNLLPKTGQSTGKVDIGEDLESILRTSGKMVAKEALRYLTAVISALEGLHAAKQTHGGLSPDLLLIAKGDDGAPRLRLLKNRKRRPTMQDASNSNAPATRDLLYASPEHVEGGTPTEATDLYALALVAYALLVGEPYWIDEVDRVPFATFCQTIINGLPEAPSVRAMRRKGVRLPQDFDAWFVLATSRKHPDRFHDITDAGIALTSVLSNPDRRELSRSFQFKFDANILQMPAENAPPGPALPPAPEPVKENLPLTALFAIFASVSVAVAIVMALRWTNEQTPPHHDRSNQWVQQSDPASANKSSSTNSATNRP